MAGHSKWANIQHRKGRQDEKRQRIWTRVVREIMVAARQGGGDPSANPRLRLAIDKAKAANMPADTIKRNIDKATGNLEGVNYEEIRYEGYGIGGAAIIVDTMTDNRVRTVAEVRHAFSKHGGNLGTSGSVAYNFRKMGVFRLDPSGIDQDDLELYLIDHGLDEMGESTGEKGEPQLVIRCAFEDFGMLQEALEQRGLSPLSAEHEYVCMTPIELPEDQAQEVLTLVDKLEQDDDVQRVFHTLA